MKKSIRIIVILLAVLFLLVGIYFMMGGKLMEKFTGESSATISAFLLPGCGWCEKFKPEWAKFTDMAKKEGFNTKTIDAQEQSELVTQKGITAFPTVQVEKNGKTVEYNGNRTAEDLLKFVKSA